MKSIRFRAWDTHEEVMNRVDYIDFANGIVGLSNENVKEYEQPIHRVEIMQSTGFNDKNNKEIYEGDIVKFDNDIPHLVFRSFIGPEMRLWRGVAQNQPLFNDMGKVLEVIGNRYENPELMLEALKKVKEMEDELS